MGPEEPPAVPLLAGRLLRPRCVPEVTPVRLGLRGPPGPHTRKERVVDALIHATKSFFTGHLGRIRTPAARSYLGNTGPPECGETR